MYAVHDESETHLELLLTLGADPKACRGWPLADRNEACRIVLDRFEQRTTLACCLRYYDELHQAHTSNIPADVKELLKNVRIVRDSYPELKLAWSTLIRGLEQHPPFIRSPLDLLDPDIAALSQFAKILHDLHGINGDMHSISRIILSYI
jgi:hypothetical protein